MKGLSREKLLPSRHESSWRLAQHTRSRSTLITTPLYRPEELEDRFQPEGVIGHSHAIKQTIEKVKQLTRDPDIAILLAGESGTGKELIARTIHYNSARAQFPFVAVNCGALPDGLIESELFGHEKGAFTGAAREKKGLFEVAHRGTLLLDEIDALPLSMQVKLLRALDEHEIRRVGGTKNIPVDLRIISASNQNLERLVDEKAFRQDLYYRLAVATIALPPLRERQGDVPLLVEHFLEKFNRAKNKTVTIAPETTAALEDYGWAGNVRELEHLIEVLVVTVPSAVVTAQHLPERFTRRNATDDVPLAADSFTDDFKAATKSIVTSFERDFILRQLEKRAGALRKPPKRSASRARRCTPFALSILRLFPGSVLLVICPQGLIRLVLQLETLMLTTDKMWLRQISVTVYRFCWVT